MAFATDDLIEKIAADQLGLVTRAQLRARGITPHLIATRVKAKRLRPLHRGVYHVGGVVPRYARELAAVLACGPHAVLSHRSAGWLWQIMPDPGDAAPVEVNLHQGDRGHRPHIQAHRMHLPPTDVTIHEKIPVTTPRRTVMDLAVVLGIRDLEQVLAKAERLNLIDRRDLPSLATQRTGRPGAVLLRSLLATEAGPAFTRSEAEERFLAVTRKAQLPAPETNVRIGNYEVDFFWRRERLVVEVDGFEFHATARSFENDRRRDASLTASGVRVMRVTWRQLTREPEAMLVRLAQALARTGP